MATIKTAVDIDVNVQGTQTVQQASQGFDSLKTQFRAAKKEAELLTAQYGLMDERTQAAIRRTGEFKDQMEELSRRIESQKSGMDTHLQAIRGVAGGFEAAAGAAALMGVESEDLQKTLLKVQGAMAFAQGIDQFMDFLPAIKSTAVALKNQLIPALRTTQGLIKGLGIGAIVGLVIMFKDKLLELVGPLRSIVQTFTDWIGLTSEMERTMEAAYLAAEKQADAIQRQIDLRTAQGASEQELYKLQKQLAEQQLVMAQNMAAEEEEQIKEKEKAILDANNRIEIIEAEHQKHLKEIREEELKSKQEVFNQKWEEYLAEKDFNEALSLLYKERNLDAYNFEEGKYVSIKASGKFWRNILSNQEKESFSIQYVNLQEQKKKELKLLEEAYLKEYTTAENYRKRKEQLENYYDEQERQRQLAIKMARVNQQQKLADESLSIFSNLYEALADKQEMSSKHYFNAQKNFAIATATVDTYFAAQKAYLSQMTFTPDAPIRAYIAAAAAVASGLARVQQIRRQEYKPSGSPSTSSTSFGNVSVTAPRSFQASTLGQDFSGQTRVYVTEGDITKTQRRVQNNQRVSVIGG